MENELKCGCITTKSRIGVSMVDGRIVFNCGGETFRTTGDVEQIYLLKQALDSAYKLGFADCGSELMPKLMEAQIQIANLKTEIQILVKEKENGIKENTTS